MANQDSMRELGTQFGIGTSTTHKILNRVFSVFISEFDNVIQWPDQQEQQNISVNFQLLSGLQGVIRVLDGTHIRLSTCPQSDNDYINRKSFPSIQLQVPDEDEGVFEGEVVAASFEPNDTSIILDDYSSTKLNDDEITRIFPFKEFIAGTRVKITKKNGECEMIELL